jgi:hypothetical protein
MPERPFSTYNYNACAHAFGGHFMRPFNEVIDVQASTSLPIIGGYGSARVENFRYREFVSFRAGYTHVSGGLQEEDGSHNTLVTSALESLNLLDVVTADRIVCRLYSKHHPGKKEAEITIVGSKFENLRIAGHPVKIELDFALFESIPTYAAAATEFAKKSKFRKIAEDPFKNGAKLPDSGPNGAFLCSCVKELETDCPGVARNGHWFHIKGFGKIFLGELLIKHGERTLNMIRVEFGSSTSGSGSGGSGKTNGTHYP